MGRGRAVVRGRRRVRGVGFNFSNFFFLESEGVEGCEVVDWGEDWGWESI